MMCTLNYNLSLGKGCIGNQDSCKGQFQVELTDSEIQQVKSALAKADKEVPDSITVQHVLPAIHASIMKEVTPIAFDYITIYSFKEGYTEISPFDVMEEDVASGSFDPASDPDFDGTEDSMYDVWDNWQLDKFASMSLHDKAEYLRNRYKLEIGKEDVNMIDIQYTFSENFKGNKEHLTTDNTMKRHRSFEFFIGDYFKSLGYEVEVCQGVNDWGADLFLHKDGVKYVVQAKMYGTSKTKVSRKQLFELHGVMAYFDCAKSILVYNGKIMPDALLVAEKLGIELVYLDYKDMEPELEEDVFADDEHSFYTIWNEHIKALAGKTIANERGLTCQVGEVTDGYIERISAKGVKTRISADLFKWVVDRIHSHGHAESIDLRNEFNTRFSSFVTLVFANIPCCRVMYNPRTIYFQK